MILAAAINLNPPNYGFERFMRNDSQDGLLAKSAGLQNQQPKTNDKTEEGELSPEEMRQVQQLKERDRQVRAHEQAHIAVGGDLIRGGASYTYQTGPDKQRYAIGGEVSIDVSPARTAEATVLKAQHIQETALAPADPSPQDQRVAATGRSMEINARNEVAAEKSEQAENSRETQFYQDTADSSQSFGPGQHINAFA